MYDFVPDGCAIASYGLPSAVGTHGMYPTCAIALGYKSRTPNVEGPRMIPFKVQTRFQRLGASVLKHVVLVNVTTQTLFRPSPEGLEP